MSYGSNVLFKDLEYESKDMEELKIFFEVILRQVEFMNKDTDIQDNLDL